ncbi:MAG: hypothetical protein CBB66_01755 [bacterium TMED6]|nr:MAG: hypothetical protein CBB66_01755 [bacterium TMED6]
MKLYKIIILFVGLSNIYFAQFSEVLIDIDYSNISEKEMFIFENFEDEIKAYFKNNYFFDDPDKLSITLDIHMVIENINNKGGEKIISAQILFSNQKDQHHYSKGFDFLYNRGEALYKTEMFHPLTSLLNCFAYLQIAYELDTYEYLGGNKYFLKSQNIASDAKNSMYSRNWQSRLKKIRKQIEQTIYRELRYNFWVVIDELDKDYPNFKEANKYYNNFYESLIAYDEYYGYGKPLSQFLNAYNLDIVQISKRLEFQKIIDYLSIYDESNRVIYQKYYQN